MIHIHVDIEPQPKLRARVAGKVAYTPAKTRAYENTLQCLLILKHGRNMLLDPLALAIRFHLPRPDRPKHAVPGVRPDLDNYVKAVLDAGNGVLWKDDGQVIFTLAEKVYAKAAPGIDLWVDTNAEFIARDFLATQS